MALKESKASIEVDFSLDDYTYELPEELIAQTPVDSRGQSRLLVVEKNGSELISSRFDALLAHLPKNSLIIANNSTVVPARIRTKSEQGSMMEMLLLTPLDLLHRSMVQEGSALSVYATALMRPSRRIKPGRKFIFGDLHVEVLEKLDFGRCRIQLQWAGQDLENILERQGEMPLPPYIHRVPGQMDTQRYQTVYADQTEKGSIAAPTAGLHFTREMRQRLLSAGHAWTEVTLYVGYGTFSPIRCQDIREHQMHSEYVKIREEAVNKILDARKDNQPIIAVGTTSMRTVEGIVALKGGLEPYQGWLDTYIFPGFHFKIVQGLLTNFHLPKSSLLVLISAFAGRERIFAAYRRAVAERYQFFSYGDAMFIKP